MILVVDASKKSDVSGPLIVFFFFLLVFRKLVFSFNSFVAKIKHLSNGCRRWDGPRALNRAIRRWFYKSSGFLEKEQLGVRTIGFCLKLRLFKLFRTPISNLCRMNRRTTKLGGCYPQSMECLEIAFLCVAGGILKNGLS